MNAGPLSTAEAQAIQQVIVTQLRAFAEDDADAAFEAATPRFREAIGSSGLFLAMVRGSYPMIYHPASVSFQKSQELEGLPGEYQSSFLQLVQITDDGGKSWLALFELERQADNSWRISGCVVKENHWQAA
ncbi:MAG: DUF4864 domain-containing protein [Burkholderiaceae bacterium]